jgi:hypothetical protein
MTFTGVSRSCRRSPGGCGMCHPDLSDSEHLVASSSPRRTCPLLGTYTIRPLLQKSVAERVAPVRPLVHAAASTVPWVQGQARPPGQAPGRALPRTRQPWARRPGPSYAGPIGSVVPPLELGPPMPWRCLPQPRHSRYQPPSGCAAAASDAGRSDTARAWPWWPPCERAGQGRSRPAAGSRPATAPRRRGGAARPGACRTAQKGTPAGTASGAQTAGERGGADHQTGPPGGPACLAGPPGPHQGSHGSCPWGRSQAGRAVKVRARAARASWIPLGVRR